MDFKEIVQCGDYRQSCIINEKKVYIFETHNMALPIWGYESSVLGEPLNLITFDTHTDTQKPFTKGSGISEREAFANKHYKRTDFKFNDVWFVCAMGDIRNSEQILAGVKYGYLSSYSVIQNRNAVADGFEEYDRCEGYDAHYFEKSAIDWERLYSVSEPIVLDFDLDYFNKEDDIDEVFIKGISPLIKRAEFITIAKEPWHFEDCKEQDGFELEQTLERLLSIIDSVTAD